MGGWDAGDSAGNQRSGARARDEVAPGSREGRCGERSEVSSGDAREGSVAARLRRRCGWRDVAGCDAGGARREAGERNALPRHFKSFVVATGVVLVGVGLVRTNAGRGNRRGASSCDTRWGCRRGERAGPRIRVEERRRDVLYFTKFILTLYLRLTFKLLYVHQSSASTMT